jgi:O-antigen ligase
VRARPAPRGRADASADDSTLARLGCACAGIKMLLSSPLLGVGYARFNEHHGQTAHNSYILAAGELGVPGALLFAFILYLAVKVPVTILRLETAADPETRTVRALALAVLASFAGGAVGIFFLSWTYHYVLWIHIGLSGALFALVKHRHPAYACRLTLREALRIALAFAAMLVAWSWYIRHKGAWE